MNFIKKFLKLFSTSENKNLNYAPHDVFQDQVKVLLNKNTLKRAIDLKAYGSKVGFELFNISFRLYKTNFGTVNLESKERDEDGIFFKTIGYYTITNGKVASIHLLKEFEEPYRNLKINSPLVKFLSKEENIYIAFCSRETSNIVKRMFNSPKYNVLNHLSAQNFQRENLKSNGINIQVKTSMMGSLEAVCVDKQYNYDDDIFVMFQNNNGINFHCSEPIFHKLHKQKLLGALN